MMMGARVSLTVGASTLLVAGVLGVIVGLLASLLALRKTATVQPALAFGG